jgi:hypothetical protein
VDLTGALGSVFAAFGLAGAAGLNAWIPLLTTALLARAGAIDLAEPYDDLTSTPGLILLGVAFAADFVGDKVPVVDHVLHAIGSVVNPAAGAVLFAGSTGVETDIPTIVALLAGGSVAGALHAGRATVRPASTAGTAGIGNPVLSLLEDAGSLALTGFALLLPIIAFLAVIGAFAGVVMVWRRLRRRPPV